MWTGGLTFVLAVLVVNKNFVFFSFFLFNISLMVVSWTYCLVVYSEVNWFRMFFIQVSHVK